MPHSPSGATKRCDGQPPRVWSVQGIMSFHHPTLAGNLSGPLAAAVLALALLSPASGETLRCAGLQVSVVAEDPTLANRICRVAATALDRLSQCGLRQTSRFDIRVSRALPSAFDGCFGVYHCADNSVEILDPAALARAAEATGNFAQLPTDVLFDSLIVHEISHVLTYQSGLSNPRTSAEIEYIAYAMQMEALPASARDLLRRAHAIQRPVTVTSLNDVILAFAPEVFAVKAWTHFTTPGNGCSFVQRVLDGTVPFPSTFR